MAFRLSSSDEQEYSSVRTANGGLLGGGDDDEEVGIAVAFHPNVRDKRNRNYCMMFTALVFFVVGIASAVFLGRGYGQEEPHDWAGDDAVVTPKDQANLVGSSTALDESQTEKPTKKNTHKKVKSKEDVFEELETVEKKIQKLKNESEDTFQDDGDVKQKKEEDEDELADLEKELIKAAMGKELEDGTLDYESDFKAEAENLEEEIKEHLEGGDDNGQFYAQEKVKQIEDLMESASTTNLLQIKATALTTIKRFHPDVKTGGQLHLSVEGGERISFVRFELPSLEDEELTKATLNLYLTSQHEEVTKVSVEALPRSGVWFDGSVSWNEQVKSGQSFFVDSFEVKGLESGDKKQLYEVDVTSAIRSTSKRITFKVSTESSGRIDFAGRMWQGGKAVPELMVALSSSAAESAQTDVFDKLELVEKEIQELNNENDDTSDHEKEQKIDELAELEADLIEDAIEQKLEDGTLDYGSDFGLEVENLEEEFEEELEDIQGGDDNEASYAKEKVEGIEDIMESASSLNLLQVKSTASTTIKKSHPDTKVGGELHLSVEGDEKISFIRFELPSVLEDEEVTKATLNLYLISQLEKPTKVSIEALPHGGLWYAGSVSWNDRVESRESSFVGSFEAKGLESGDKKQLYEVDVTSAIDSTLKQITFKISTESSSRLDFAGEMWQGGKAVPELMLALAPLSE